MISFKSCVLSLFLAVLVPVVANAGVVINLVEQTNGTLLMTYSGSINMATLGGPVAGNYNQGSPMFSAFQGYTRIGSFVDLYNTGSLSAPATFGAGGQIVPTFVSPGSSAFAADFLARTVSVPTGYISNSPISGSATFSGSLATNGINAGTYSYSWGSGITESVTLNVSTAAAVPEPATLGIFAIGTLVGCFGCRRRAGKSSPN